MPGFSPEDFILAMILKREKWSSDFFVGQELTILPSSDPVKEVVRCIDYMRNILE